MRVFAIIPFSSRVRASLNLNSYMLMRKQRKGSIQSNIPGEEVADVVVVELNGLGDVEKTRGSCERPRERRQ
jgi:hypothetical protein